MNFVIFIMSHLYIRIICLPIKAKIRINNLFEHTKNNYIKEIINKNNFNSLNNIINKHIQKKKSDNEKTLTQLNFESTNFLKRKINEDDSTSDENSEEEIIEEIINNSSKQYYNESNNNINLSIIRYGSGSSTSSQVFIDLSECIIILQNYLSLNSSFYILQIEIEREDEVVNQFEYSIFLSNGTELNLTLCSGAKVNISVSINKSLVENYEQAYDIFNKYGYDIYNINDPFYNDICTFFTSEYGTDVTLEYRKKYYYKNISFCEENCSYINFNYLLNSVTCQCNIKQIINLNHSNFNYSSFSKVEKKFSNKFSFQIYKCFKSVFSISRLKKNIGSYIIIGFLIIEVFLLFLFCGVGLIPTLQLFEIILRKQTINKDMMIKKIDGSTSNINFMGNNNINRSVKDLNTISQNEKILIKENISKNNSMNIIKIKEKEVIKNNDSYNEINSKKLFKYSKNIIKGSSNIIKTIIEEKKTLNNKNKSMTDFELNTLSFKEVIIYDKRNFINVYCSQIKYAQLFIFTFFASNDGNARIIKLFLFIFYFSMIIFINSFFFDLKNINELYTKKKKVDYLYDLKNPIIYSFIGGFFFLFFKFLALNNIKKFIRDIKQFNKQFCIAKTQIGIFFILQFIFLFGFWYFISLFCSIYYNSQYFLIYKCGISFITYMIFPFFSVLISVIFRLIGIKKQIPIIYYIGRIIVLF